MSLCRRKQLPEVNPSSVVKIRTVRLNQSRTTLHADTPPNLSQLLGIERHPDSYLYLRQDPFLYSW